MVGAEQNIEKIVIEQLQGYKRLCGRIRVLERQPIGMGLYLEPTGEDRLQALHRKLKDLPSHLYLSKHEQEIEETAHAYLTKYPLGTRAQLYEVKGLRGVDSEDRNNLKELSIKIQKVIDARQSNIEGYDGVLERLTKLQELQEQKDMIDTALESLTEYKPQYAKLLLLRYVEGHSVDETAATLQIVRKTFRRWEEKAIHEYAVLVGIS